MKKTILFCIGSLLSMSLMAQVNNWVGSVSTDYFNKYNWSDTTINFTLLTSTTLQIGPGSPYNCTLVGGNSSNTNYRPNRLNTLTGGVFTVSGAVYPNNNDSLNGSLVLGASADLNIRNIAYIGNKTNAIVTINGGKLSTKNGAVMATGTGGSATLTLNGGSFNVGGGGSNMDLTMANAAGLTAQLNIIGGSVNIARNLVIGNGGHIHISGIGFLKVAGDKTVQLNGLVADGRLTCTPGKTLSIVYDGTNTIASIPQNPNSMITEYPDSVVIKSGVIVVNIDKSSAHIQSYRYRGFELSNDMYSSWVTPTYSQPSRCVYSAKIDSSGLADISLKQTYLPGTDEGAFDVDLHYVVSKGDSGVYTYIIWNHPETYPATHVDENRYVWKINQDQTEVICVDSARTWQMPNAYDRANATQMGIAEIIRINTGVRAGQYDCKYEFAKEYWNVGTYGHASNVNKIGVWAVFGGYDYFNDGPTKQDLSSAAGIIHIHFGMDHYGGSNTPVAAGENWSKIFGPFLLYANYNAGGVTALWNDARSRADLEKSKWPYNWLVNEPTYPLAGGRGSVSGTFVVNDPSKPGFTGANAMIGITNPDAGTNWQNDSRHYQYWVKSDAEGNFTIPNIRPGTYNLYAFVTGELKEFTKSNIVVTAGANNDQGTLTWNIPRADGPIVWELGIPDRKAQEFKHGNDYFVPYKFLEYSRDFTNPLVYTVGQSNWATDLNYAHGGYNNYPDSVYRVWPWLIKFNITSLPPSGNVKLTLAFAGSESARMDLYVNDDPALLSRFYPREEGGNALLREGIHSKYWDTAIYIPVSKLRLGSNTINLTQGRGAASSDHVMYDYISLEGNIQISLPVKFLSFTANATNSKQVSLNWKTAYEINSHHFEIERSSDGSSFETIATISSNGTATNGSSYSMIDPKPFDGINFYRLKQVDADGKISYSQIRQVRFSSGKILIYPNPATNRVNVQPANGKLLSSVALYDIHGKLLAGKTNIAGQDATIDVSALPAGFYLIKASDGTTTVTEKISKQQR